MELLELRLLHEGPGIDKYAYIYIWEFPKIRGTLLWGPVTGPYNKDPTI